MLLRRSRRIWLTEPGTEEFERSCGEVITTSSWVSSRLISLRENVATTEDGVSGLIKVGGGVVGKKVVEATFIGRSVGGCRSG